MSTQQPDAGTLFVKRIEDLLRSSTLPPEQIVNILRAAQADPACDPLREIERLQREQQSDT